MKKFFEIFQKDNSNLVLGVLALIKLALHLSTSGGYGYFRDEFYYIAASKHLAFGYVDFPPFIALLTALIRGTLGESLFPLRFLPALAGACLIYLTGLMARQLGAGRFGQSLAALGTLIAPQYLGMNSVLTMDSFDMLFWGLAIYIFILILKYDRPVLWLWFGLVAGLALTTKISMLYFGFALVIGLALTAQRRYFRSAWMYLGGGIAMVFLIPYVIWNAINGWPTVEFFAAYGNKVYETSPVGFILQQILIMHPLTLPLWVMGLTFFFSRKGETYRPLGWIYIVLLLVFMIQNAKNYFLAPIYPVLFAAGALQFEGWIQARRFTWMRQASVAILAAGGMLTAPMAIPIFPQQAHIAYLSLMGGTNVKSEIFETGVFPQHLADRFGWRELAAAMADVHQQLPPEDQGRACIFTGNYGEAGALEFFGLEYGLPPIISGHNNYYLWGPGDCTGEVMIVIGEDLEDLKQVFRLVEQAGRTDCIYCMPYEDNLPIYVAHDLSVPLIELWPGVKFYQ